MNENYLPFINFAAMSHFDDQYDQFMILNFTNQSISANPITHVTKIIANHQLAVMGWIFGLFNVFIQVVEDLPLDRLVKTTQIFKSRCFELIIPRHVWLPLKSKFFPLCGRVFLPLLRIPNLPNTQVRHAQRIFPVKYRLGVISATASFPSCNLISVKPCGKCSPFFSRVQGLAKGLCRFAIHTSPAAGLHGHSSVSPRLSSASASLNKPLSLPPGWQSSIICRSQASYFKSKAWAIFAFSAKVNCGISFLISAIVMKTTYTFTLSTSL